jgi:MATE family multidrug resistance protein
LLQGNRHLFVRTLCLLFSFAFFTAMSENFGSQMLAANTLMIQLLMMAAYGMDGFAFAVEGLAGHALGRRDMPGFHIAVRRCAGWTMIAAASVSLALLLLQSPLGNLLTGLDSVKELMYLHWPWLVALPLLAGPSYLLDGVFIGTAETRYMMTTMVFSVIAVYLPLWYLCQPLGSHGLWLAFAAFNAARGISLYFYFRQLNLRGGWLKTGGR